MKQPDEATLGGESRRTNGSLEGIVAAAQEAADGIETRVETSPSWPKSSVTASRTW
jgi:hypothetical protein